MTNKMTLTLWKVIPGIAGYEASDDGQIRSIDRVVAGKRFKGRLLKQTITNNGYHTFRTTGKTHLVSRAVLAAFTGDVGVGFYACHNNGKKSENHLSNLRWDTPSGNQADRVLHQTHHRGQKHPNAKLSNAQVEEILNDSRMHKLIAQSYGVSTSHISSIKCGCFRKNG